MNKKTLATTLFALATSFAFAADYYFTQGPEILGEGQVRNRSWHNVINWGTSTPTSSTGVTGSYYNTSIADSVPTSGDRAILGGHSGDYEGAYKATRYVEISEDAYASQLSRSGAYVVAGLKSTNSTASLNLTLEKKYNNRDIYSGNGSATLTNVVIDASQWDSSFTFETNIKLHSTSGDTMRIYSNIAQSSGKPRADNTVMNLTFSDGYTIEVLPDATDGKYGRLEIINARRSYVNGNNLYIGDIVINSKIKTGGDFVLRYDPNQTVATKVDPNTSEEIVYTPGVIRFTGSQTNELSNTGLQLNQGIIVESGMKNGAQICTTAVQIMQGSTLKLLASDQIGDNASLQLKTAFSAGEIGGNFLMNGFNERVGTLFLYNDAATVMDGIIDFGENETSQIFWAARFQFGGNIVKEGSYLIIKNFDYLLDHFYTTEKMSEANFEALVFDGYDMSQFEIVENYTTVNYDGVSDVAVYEYTLNQIPEPSTYAVFAGLIALGLAVYRRKN